MGAKQRAQKRGKAATKAAKGSLKGSPASQKKSNSSLYVSDLNPTTRSNALLGWQSFAKSSSPPRRTGFSMSQEARNTERQEWGSAKFREQGISFVSAGNLNQNEEEQESEQEEAGEEEALEEEAVAEADFVPGPSTISNGPPASEDRNPVLSSDNPVTRSPEQPVDTTHSILDDLEKAIDPPAHDPASAPRTRSSSASSSDAEQIVFRGRQNPSLPPSAPASRVRSTAEVHRSSPPVVEEPKHVVPQAVTASHPFENILPPKSSSGGRQQFNPRHRGGGRRGRLGGRNTSEEDAIMRDYVANMVMEDSDDEEVDGMEDHQTSKPVRKNEHFRFFDGAGEENVKVKLHTNRVTPGRSPDVRESIQALDWDSEDLELFDDFSTTDDDDVVEIEQVLRQRERPGGLQYLVVATSEDGDPKWVLSERLVSKSAKREIKIFEEIQAMEFEEASFTDDSSDDDSEDEDALNDLIEHIESEDDENAKILELTSRMTDAQIAQALAKQEELGLGGDELMLFSGNVGEDDGEDGADGDDMDAFGRGDDFVSFSLKHHTSNRGRSKRNKKRDSFPSAAALADAIDEDPYGAFDVMDFDRPSLKPKKKGRKSDFPYDLELEDDDLKEQIVSTWARDREKKAARKREKEEARMAAVIEASERNEPGAIKAEIRRFLVQEVEVLKLAPMDSHIRASIHRLAKALKLNSHSEGKEGKGAGRFPVLTKTPRTPSYSIDTIWEIDALLNTRKYFPKSLSFKAPKGVRSAPTARMRRGGGGGGGVNGATYMNGEVVGASAPELGADNKGRLLLEKMGWSAGMGIGKEGNKGSLDAIKHVVKTTKAGLG